MSADSIPAKLEALRDEPERKLSKDSEVSQTAAEFIDDQLQLEADAREVLPYAFDSCTQALGPLRQIVFSCLTCNPPPNTAKAKYNPAGICYSCSIACHGDHELVELFNKRNFVCDCGTTRLPADQPCTLRLNPETGMKGGSHSESAAEGNKYNHNFRNRFCGCEEVYDAHNQRGTMYQCLGLEGGCGEDWWHSSCVVGDTRFHMRQEIKEKKTADKADDGGGPHGVVNSNSSDQPGSEAKPGSGLEHPLERSHSEDLDEKPSDFPNENDFDVMICYQCVDANPWIKKYAYSKGFLPPIYLSPFTQPKSDGKQIVLGWKPDILAMAEKNIHRRKRAADDDDEVSNDGTQTSKRQKVSPAESVHGEQQDQETNKEPQEESHEEQSKENGTSAKEKNEKHKPRGLDQPCIAIPDHTALANPPRGKFTLFAKEDFREYLCRCKNCFPKLKKHPQLLEEEDTYEPPPSESEEGGGGSTVGTGSLLDRGEKALNNMDRVKAIEGVMVYNHLKDRVKSFLKPFAESGEAVGADDIKKYFEQLRGDAEAMKEASLAARQDEENGGGDDGNGKREQSGY